MQYNTLRCATILNGEALSGFYPNNDVGPFLERAKNSKYNYILAGFSVDVGRNTSLLTKKEDFKRAFKKVDEYGLRMIPMIGMGGQWATHWLYAKQNWNSKIQMVWVEATEKIAGGTIVESEWACPSYKEDAEGFDKTFIEFLQMICDAHREAGVSYPLEFIHLGHDEPALYCQRLLIGSCKTGVFGKTNQFNVTRVLTEVSADKSYILSFSTTQRGVAVSKLIVSELYRRTQQVKTYLGSNVRILIYGDYWDPQMNGTTRPQELWTGQIINPLNPSNLSNSIGTLPGLTDLQKAEFRDKVIICPWNYKIDYDPDGDKDSQGIGYHTDKTFQYLSNNKLKFIYVHEITPGNVLPYDPLRTAQAQAFYNTSKNFKQYCLGYNAAAFWGWEYPEPSGSTPFKCFESIEYLYGLNQNDLPSCDFDCKSLVPIINMLLE